MEYEIEMYRKMRCSHITFTSPTYHGRADREAYNARPRELSLQADLNIS